jgi:MFS family permease
MRFVYGIFFCAVFPALNGLVVKSTPDDFRGRAFGLNQTANQIGGTVGPMMGGMIAGVLPVSTVFFATGILLLIALGFAYANSNNLKQPLNIKELHGK